MPCLAALVLDLVLLCIQAWEKILHKLLTLMAVALSMNEENFAGSSFNSFFLAGPSRLVV